MSVSFATWWADPNNIAPTIFPAVGLGSPGGDAAVTPQRHESAVVADDVCVPAVGWRRLRVRLSPTGDATILLHGCKCELVREDPGVAVIRRCIDEVIRCTPCNDPAITLQCSESQTRAHDLHEPTTSWPAAATARKRAPTTDAPISLARCEGEARGTNVHVTVVSRRIPFDSVSARWPRRDAAVPPEGGERGGGAENVDVPRTAGCASASSGRIAPCEDASVVPESCKRLGSACNLGVTTARWPSTASAVVVKLVCLVPTPSGHAPVDSQRRKST